MHPKQQQQLFQALAAQNEQTKKLKQQLPRYKILSTLPYQKVPLWWQNVDSILPKTPRGVSSIRYFFSACWHILRLLTVVNRYDVVLLSGGERRDLFYIALAGCLPWIKTPHIITDAHWQAKTGLKLWIQRKLFQFANRLLVEVQPHSVEECYIYSQQFNIPFDKMNAIAWSVSLIGYELHPTRNSTMILTGGASFRDYDVFYHAVKNLPLPIEVGLPAWFNNREIKKLAALSYVTVHHDLNQQQYYEKMAQCRILAIPMPAGLTRCAGDQTLLNAMSLGKIVVATDSIASRLYIRHGENGFLIPPYDVKKWQTTLSMIAKMKPSAYQKIADCAEFDAKCYFNENKRIQDTLLSALAILQPNQQNLSRITVQTNVSLHW